VSKYLLAVLCALAILLPAIAEAETTVTPYGFVLLNASYSTRTVNDYPFLAAAPGTGEPNFIMTPRQSRLGVRIKSDAAHSPAGSIEVDFWGLRGSGRSGSLQTAPRLRRAFLELDFNELDLLAGQDWIAPAPLNPTSIMHVAIVGMMNSGNLWGRAPQIRGSWMAVADENQAVKLDLALARPIANDATMTPVEQGDVLGAGERYGWPAIQGRAGYSIKGSTALSVGLGGTYCRMDFGDDPAGDDNFGTSHFIAGDAALTAGRLTFQGEAYVGENIGGYSSNAGYVLVADSMRVDGVWSRYSRFEGIQATGGWGEVKLAVTPVVDVAVNAGMESVDDEFLGNGAVKSNFTVMGNVIHKGIKGVQIGLEAGYIQTERIHDKPGTAEKETDDGRDNMNVNLSFMFSF